jgi:hypothetical protein
MAMKTKPKGWNAMSKAKQDAWKKANFDSSTKVTTAQLDKLRAEKTPEKAIAKYKNDPAMREALNRFYGKTRVGSAPSTGSGTGKGSGGENAGPGLSSSTRGGPGAKPRQPRSSTATRTYGTRTGGNITVNAAADDKRKADFQRRTGTAIGLGASFIPLLKGAMLAKGAFQGAQKAQAIAKAAKSVPKAAPKPKAMPKAVPKAAPKAAPKVAPKVTPKVAPKPKAMPMRNPAPKPKVTPKAAPKKTTPKK